MNVCISILQNERPSCGLCSRPQVWLQYQCLWDMQAENIYNRLGEDLNKWQALLVQIRKARGTFDNAETKKEFGPVVIDYGKVSLLAGGAAPVALKRHLGLAAMQWECACL